MGSNCVKWSQDTTLKTNHKNQIKISAHFVFFPVCQPSNMPDQARIRFGCGQLWPLRPAGIGPDPICRIHIGCYFPALEVARIRIRSVFVHPACFRYLCVMPDPLGLNEARSDPPPATRIRTTSGISNPGWMVIDRSESGPFFYIWPASDIDALCRIRLAWTKPDPTRFKRNGSGPHPAFLFRVGWSSTDPNRVHFSTFGLLPILMRYAGSAWPEWSQIRPASGETDPDHIPFCIRIQNIVYE